MSNTTPNASPFTGSIPQYYDQYLGPMFFEEYAIEVASRVKGLSAEVALELSCGTGRVTNHLRRVLPPTSKLIASDISEEMLQVAKEKLVDKDIEWQIIDLHELPFPDNHFELVVCCFGYMFALDKAHAFKEAHRVLRSGGILLISTWDKLEYNEASHVFRKTIKKYLGDPLPESYSLPFSMNDPAMLKGQLRLAGFKSVDVEPIVKNAVNATAAQATYGLVQGGSLYNEIMKRNPSWVQEITASVEKELTTKYGAAPMTAPMRALITTAGK